MSNKTAEPLASGAAPASNAPGLVPDLPADASAPPVRCVVIDDDPGVQNILTGAAASLGLQVARFRGADKALKTIASVKPGIVFLDLSLEGSDAIDVIRGLDACGFKGAVQLISGRDPQTLDEVCRVGARHSLTMLPPLKKPFRLEEVRAVIRQQLAAPAQKGEIANGAP